jgi:hypothetical protein
MEYIVTATNGDEEVLAAVRETEFLVVAKLAGCHFNHFERLVDEALGGLLSERISGWSAEFGSYRLLYLPAARVQFGKLKYVLIMGMGQASGFHGKHLCAFTNFTVGTAALTGVSRITYLESPYRSTEPSISLRGTSAIIRCRVELFGERHRLRNLKEVQFIACHQAARHLQTGLDLPTPRCRACTSPVMHACQGGCK